MKQKPHFAVPTIDLKRNTQSALKKVRKPENPIDSIRNNSVQNERYSIQASELEGKRQALLDTLSDLNERVIQDGDLIAGLRDKFQALLHGKKQYEGKTNKYEIVEEKVSKEVKDIIDGMGRLTPPLFLDQNPIIIDDFFNNTDIFAQVSEQIPDYLMVDFYDTSMEQINAFSKCIQYYKELKDIIYSTSFPSKCQTFAQQCLNTREVVLLVHDIRCEQYYADISNKKYFFPIEEDKSFVGKALHDQKPFLTNAPNESDLYFPPLDQLVNPGNRPILIVPIQKNGVLYFSLTTSMKNKFSVFDTYVATFFSDIISPILDDHIKYIQMARSVDIRRSLQIFKTNLVSKATFAQLIPFLFETFNDCLSTLDVEFYIHNNGILQTFKINDKGQLIKSEYKSTGLPSVIINSRDKLMIDKVTERTPSYNETIDKWTLNNTFLGSPIITPAGEIIAVLCLSGKATSNKFTQWDSDFLKTACEALALVIPHCIDHMDTQSEQSRIDKAILFPSLISNYNYDILKDQKVFQKIGDDLKNLFNCEYVGIFKKEPVAFRTIYLSSENKFLNDECIIDLLNSEIGLISKDFLSFKNFQALNDIKYQNIAVVTNTSSETKVALVLLNLEQTLSLKNSGFDEQTINKMKSYAIIAQTAIDIQKMILTHELTDLNTITIRNSFDVSKTAILKENPLESLLSMITELLTMHSFCVFEKRVMYNGYFPYIASNEVKMSGSVSMDDILSQMIMTNPIITLYDKFYESTIKSSLYKDYFKPFVSMICFPLDKDVDYLCIFVGQTFASNYNSLLSLFSPTINILLKNYLQLNHHENIKVLNTINLQEMQVHDVEITSRLFNIENYDEPKKISLLVRACESLEIMKTLNIDEHVLVPFLIKVRKHYSKLPYHNWDHAIDTVQLLFSALIRGKIKRMFSDQQIAGMFFAALLHDIEHDGLTSDFHNNASTYYSIIYGPKSCTQKYHLSRASNLLKKQKFFSMINTDEFWDIFNSCIVGTDIQHYQEIIEQFTTTMSEFNQKTYEHRVILGQFIVICGNLVNTTRVFQESQKAVNGIIEELNIQNEKEKELNIPITKFYGQNDNRTHINECEALFIEEIALPLYKHLSEAIPELSDLSVQIEDNKRQWIKLTQ